MRLGSKLSLGLIYGLSFQFQAASYFPQSWRIFMVGIGAFRGFMRFGPNSLSRAEDLAAVNHVTQAVVRVGSKIGS